MSTERRLRLRLLAAGGITALALTGALTGCSTPAPAGGTPTVTATVPAASASASTPTTTGTASASPSASAAASPSSSSFRTAGCATSALTAALESDGGAAGSTYDDLTLRNTGSSPCTLQGWPGTSFIDSAGKQIGAAADFDRSTTHETVTLVPGGHAVARLQVAEAGNFPSSKCDEVRATRLRVYPPGSTASLTVSTPAIETCSDAASHVLRVGALHASS